MPLISFVFSSWIINIRHWPLVKCLATNLMALGSNPTRDILPWLRGWIVSPSVFGILLHAQIKPVTKVTLILLILFYIFAVNNEVETRREEPGDELGQNLDLLFDHFGPVLRYVISAKKSFIRPLKAFLACFELHWTYNSRENWLWKKAPKEDKGINLTFLTILDHFWDYLKRLKKLL